MAKKLSSGCSSIAVVFALLIIGGIFLVSKCSNSVGKKKEAKEQMSYLSTKDVKKLKKEMGRVYRKNDFIKTPLNFIEQP